MTALLLAIYLMLILIRPMDWWPPILGWQLVSAASIATTLTGFPILLSRGPLAWQRFPQLKAALAFLIGATLSYLPVFWLGGMQLAFQDIGKMVIFFAMILILVRTRHDFQILLWTVLVCIGWLAVHAILQHHRGYGFGGQLPLWRVRDRETGAGDWQAVGFGTFEDPNDLCTVLVVAIPLFYVQYKTTPNTIHQVLALVGVGLSSYGAWCTNSRGGVGAVFAMLASYVVSRLKGFRRYFMIAFAITFVTILAPSRFTGNLIPRDRSMLWGDGLAMFKSQPIFGIGYNDFRTYSSEHRVAHNTYIHTLAELGLLGYLPLFLMIYLTLLHLRRALNQKALISTKDYLLLAGVFSAVIGYLTGLYFISRQYQHIFYVILALAITVVSVVCDTYGIHTSVYGDRKQDIRRGLFWALGSVAIMWITVRVANALG